MRDLFFNVPARKKFLRSEQTELAHIASLATHYSLAHPDKSVQLLNGPKTLLDVTPVESLRDRVFQVFGSQILGDLVEIAPRENRLELPPQHDAEPGERETRNVKLTGFISQPQVQKSNRNSIYIFVNGRLIRDRLVMHAISSAYHNIIPPGTYPFALIFIDIDFEEVDVNVHPSKTEVRFRHGSWVHDFVRDALRDELMASRPVSSIPAAAFAQPTPPAGQPGARLPFSEFTQKLENFGFRSVLPPSAAPQTAGERPVTGENLPEFTLHKAAPPDSRFEFGDAPAPATSAEGLKINVPDTHGPLLEGATPMEEQTLAVLSNLRPLGQIHESFIVAAGVDGLWIIDQHVAHERILFEQVLRQRSRGQVESQRLLMPMVLELTPAQQVEYTRIADDLNSMGFETEPFGNRTIAVKAAPAAVGAADIERLVFEILEIAEGELRNVSLHDLQRAMAASIACRAAIKINTRLDQRKMEWLLSALAATEYPMSCPHGRPIALRYSMREILKGFHRI